MLREVFKYKDFDGNEVERDFYFHMSDVDLLQFSDNELVKKYQDIDNSSKTYADVIKLLKLIVSLSYGKRVENEFGVTFERNKEDTERFINSNVFSDWIWSKLIDTDKLADFVNTVLDKERIERLTKAAKESSDKKLDQKPQDHKRRRSSKVTEQSK